MNEPFTSAITQKDIKKSLHVSLLDGIYASVMVGFTMNYVTPFALLLGAKNLQIGFLNSIPQLFSSLAQLKSADMVEQIKSRVKLITLFAMLQALSLVVIFLLLFLPRKIRIESFILLVTLNTIFGALTNPPWASLLSETVDKTKYGEYFSWRGKILGFITLVSNFFAGIFLYFIKNKLLGFILLFVLAGGCRIISAYYLRQMVDIPTKSTQKDKFSYFSFIKRFYESNFVKFVFFVSLINFATFVSAPFFAVYMLKELKMSYSMYTVITTAAALSSLLLLPFWGKMADIYGNAKIVRVTGSLLWTLPILWLLSKDYLYLVLINAFAGYLWAGFNLSVVNFIFDAASAEVRTRCIGYFNFTNGIFIFLGTLLSGWLATHLPKFVFETNLFTLFLLSGIMRFLVYISLSSSFNEVKTVPQIEDKNILFTILGIKPVFEFSQQVVYFIRKAK